MNALAQAAYTIFVSLAHYICKRREEEKMGSLSHRCCGKQKVKRGLWSPEEDEKLLNYITIHGGQHGSWSCVPKLAGLERCGKSCRLRWTNYLRPEVKRGSFSAEEEEIIIDVHRILGNRWAQIAKHLPGRTDNEVKNFWNSCIKKKLIAQGLDPCTHNLISSSKSNLHHQQSPSFVLHHHDSSYQNPYTSNNHDPFCWTLKHENSNVNGSGVGDDDEIILPSKSTTNVTAVSSLSSSSSINNMVDMQFGVLNNHMSVSSSLPLVQAPTSAILYDHDQFLHQQEQQHYYSQLMKMSTQELQLEPGQDTAPYDHDMTMLSNTCSFGDEQLMDSIISASGHHTGMHELDLTTPISMDDFISCNYECNF